MNKLHISSGNHDTYLKTTNRINSLELLLDTADTAPQLYISKPQEVKFGSCWIGVIPWMTDDNWKQCIDFLETTMCPVIFGHFDVIGGMLNPGYASQFGLDPKIFSRFEIVLSGHYHTKSKIGNVHYLGTQYQMDWHDHGETKGFHVFDTESRKLEFIPSKLPPLFEKAIYPSIPDSGSKFLKLYIPEPSKETEDWIKNIKSTNPVSVEIMEGQVSVEEALAEVVENEEGDSVISQVVDEGKFEMKDKVKEMLLSLYEEAKQ